MHDRMELLSSLVKDLVKLIGGKWLERFFPPKEVAWVESRAFTKGALAGQTLATVLLCGREAFLEDDETTAPNIAAHAQVSLIKRRVAEGQPIIGPLLSGELGGSA